MSDSESDYSSDENRATSLDDPRLPGAEPMYAPRDRDMSRMEEGYANGGRGNYPGDRPSRYDDNRYPSRQVYLPNEEGPLKEPKKNVALLHQLFDMMKYPLIVAVVFMIFESNPVRNFAVRSLPIGVSFDGQLDFIGVLIIALLAGITVTLANKFVDRQVAF